MVDHARNPVLTILETDAVFKFGLSKSAYFERDK